MAAQKPKSRLETWHAHKKPAAFAEVLANPLVAEALDLLLMAGIEYGTARPKTQDPAAADQKHWDAGYRHFYKSFLALGITLPPAQPLPPAMGEWEHKGLPEDTPTEES